MKTAVIAIGGNAILPPGSGGSAEDQRRRVRATCRVLADLIAEGYDIALTHGNGPQGGNGLPRHEAGGRGRRGRATGQVPQVRVDRGNPAFRHPTKPIGPYYSKTAARELIRR